MKFELGHYYEHSTGEMIHIIALVQTRMYGTTLLAEVRGKAEIMAVGMDNDSAVNYREIQKGRFNNNNAFVPLLSSLGNNEVVKC